MWVGGEVLQELGGLGHGLLSGMSSSGAQLAKGDKARQVEDATIPEEGTYDRLQEANVLDPQLRGVIVLYQLQGAIVGPHVSSRGMPFSLGEIVPVALQAWTIM
jgi:hypothetical protein